MEKIGKKLWTALIISILIPYGAALVFSGTAAAEEYAEYSEEGEPRILLDGENGGYVTLEDYLAGVVAGQIPAEYEEETLKAQAIIARTYLIKQMGEDMEIPESSLELESLETEQLKSLWGSKEFAGLYRKVENAVKETEGQVLTYQGELIDPLFCRASAGMTRQGDDLHPYLVSVDSAKDVEMDGFFSIQIWTKEEFAEKIGGVLEGEPVGADEIPGCIQIVKRDEAGYVEEIQIGSQICSGDAVQYALGLPSPNFTIEEYGGKVRTASSGMGHGYGFSQFGANEKAKEGWTAQDLLEYYYKNIALISE